MISHELDSGLTSFEIKPPQGKMLGVFVHGDPTQDDVLRRYVERMEKRGAKPLFATVTFLVEAE